MENTIIALYGRGDEGKTSTLVRLFEILTGEELEGDISEIIIYHPIKIGIISQSDPYGNILENFKEDLKIKIDEGCQIIFVASRTSGEGVKIIDQLADENNYNTIWLSTLFCPTLNEERLNDFHATYLKKIIDELITNGNLYLK